MPFALARVQLEEPCAPPGEAVDGGGVCRVAALEPRWLQAGSLEAPGGASPGALRTAQP